MLRSSRLGKSDSDQAQNFFLLAVNVRRKTCRKIGLAAERPKKICDVLQQINVVKWISLGIGVIFLLVIQFILVVQIV